ncbi:MAG: arsenite methyltransferase [Phycisphaerales bacterium]|nr:arsenite methyltransferase [Phycisphaerales bacterium]
MNNKISEVVRAKYGLLAGSGLSGAQAGVREVAQAFGYTPEELAAIPAEANMGVSCGNPTALATLKNGEIVVDLGCGGGMDVFLAAAQVGPTGKVIGIDMTPEMINLARKNAVGCGVPPNVEFHLANIDQLPLPDASVDCVISNCVINLAPNKPAVFAEAFRVLKPGGRLAASDIALKKPLPAGWADDLLAYVGCIAGAILIEDYRRYLLEAGFSHVQIVDSGADLNAYAKVTTSCCCAPPKEDGRPPATASCCGGTQPKADQAPLHEGLANLLQDHDVNEYAASVKVYALKAPTRDGKPV